jgi:vacuolar protein sorting-associated protein 54
VVLTNILHVDSAEFKAYLSQVGPLYEQLQRVKDGEDKALAGWGNKLGDPFEGYEASRQVGRPNSPRKGSFTSLTLVITPTEGRPSSRRGSGNFSRKSHHGPAPLSTIPNIYFEEDFRLENPRTFDVVGERSDVIAPTSTTVKASNADTPAPRKALATNAILQEKLSWYLDTVEVHMINSISTASTTIFLRSRVPRRTSLGSGRFGWAD